MKEKKTKLLIEVFLTSLASVKVSKFIVDYVYGKSQAAKKFSQENEHCS